MQKGSSRFAVEAGLIPILIIILIASAVGGYFIYTSLRGGLNLSKDNVAISPTPASPVPSGAGETANPDSIGANWKTYNDSEYNFSIQYPADAEVQKKISNDLKDAFGNPVKQILFNLDTSKSSFRFYWVMIYPSSNEKSVENWMKKYDANGQEISLEDTTLDVAAAKRATNLVGGIYERQGVYALKDNFIYSVVVSAPTINEQIKAEYLQILSTFKFTQ